MKIAALAIAPLITFFVVYFCTSTGRLYWKKHIGLDLEDLYCLLVYVPWEIFICAIGAYRGWPFQNIWGWFVVGILASKVYDLRKDLML